MQFDPSRRLFLRRSAIASVVPIVAPVLPVEKVIKYFFAPTGGWTGGNKLLTPAIITREALRILKANLNFINDLNIQYDLPNVGSTIRIRKLIIDEKIYAESEPEYPMPMNLAM